MRDAEPTRLLQQLEQHASASTGCRILNSLDDSEFASWADLHTRAMEMATSFVRRGIRVGTHVALCGPTSLNLVAAIRALWLAGAVVTVAPINAARAYHQRLAADVHIQVRTETGDLIVQEIARDRRLDLSPTLAIIQPTSGTTADPKLVPITGDTLVGHVRAIGVALELDSSDRFLAWLPLYHDMGLIGFVALTMLSGIDLALVPTDRFRAQPGCWMREVDSWGATVTAGPSSAYGLVGRRSRSFSGLDLTQLRLAVNGSEQVSVADAAAFVESATAAGLRSTAMFPVYGLAEATLAVTFPRPGSQLGVSYPRTLQYSEPLARVGHPIPGAAVRIVGETASPICDGEIGEIEVAGEWIAPYYLESGPRGGANGTSDSQRDGWLATGDRGYVDNGELVICGRSKDLIVLGGENYLPDDIEQVVSRVPGIRRGCVAAVAAKRRGKLRLAIVAEAGCVADRSLENSIREALRSEFGVEPGFVRLVDRGALPRTTSGKIRRSRARTLFEGSSA